MNRDVMLSVFRLQTMKLKTLFLTLHNDISVFLS